MGGKPRTRPKPYKPRNWIDYCDRAEALRFLRGLVEMVEDYDETVMFKLRCDINFWQPQPGQLDKRCWLKIAPVAGAKGLGQS